MVASTTNYNLAKPTENEFAEISVINGNMDVIDTAIKNLDNNKEAILKNAPEKTTLEATDYIPLVDLIDSNRTKRISFSNIKAGLKTYFDTLYNKTTISNNLTTTTEGSALDAIQGKMLADSITTLNSTINVVKNKYSESAITDSNGNELIKFPAAVISAVNEITISNAATGNAPTIESTGGDPNVSLYLKAKGTGRIKTYVNGVVSGIFDAFVSAVNYLVFTSNTTGNAPRVTVEGADTNIDINLVPKGTGKVKANGLEVATKSTTVTATISAASWTGTSAPFYYTLAVAGVTATSNQELLPSTTITKAQLDAYQGANITDGGQAVGSITIQSWGTKPTVDIPVRVIVRGDA